jgi:enoyl-CoA hydratase/carnithine racemase
MSTRGYKIILIEKEVSIDWLTINQPERLNSLDTVLVAELSQYFLEVATNATVRIIVIKGAGRAFCAGFDLSDPPHLKDDAALTPAIGRPYKWLGRTGRKIDLYSKYGSIPSTPPSRP